MQSYVLWALMQEILANELTAARGSTAMSALDSSAHFRCSRSERVHHRNFFPVGSKNESRFTGFSEKKKKTKPKLTQFNTLWKREVILFYLISQVRWFCSLTLTFPHTGTQERCPSSVIKITFAQHGGQWMFAFESLLCCFADSNKQIFR